MARISNKTSYPITTPTMSDYVVGTDASNNCQTVSYSMFDISTLLGGACVDLQVVTDNGNVTTNGITVLGASSFGDIYFNGSVGDIDGSVGEANQVLVSNGPGLGTTWVDYVAGSGLFEDQGGCSTIRRDSFNTGINTSGFACYNNILGGQVNSAYGSYGTITGGLLNTIGTTSGGNGSCCGDIPTNDTGSFHQITGGTGNFISSGKHNTIAGGIINRVSGDYNTVNNAYGSVVFGGGSSNISNSNYSYACNTAYSTITGSSQSCVTGTGAFIFNPTCLTSLVNQQHASITASRSSVVFDSSFSTITGSCFARICNNCLSSITVSDNSRICLYGNNAGSFFPCSFSRNHIIGTSNALIQNSRFGIIQGGLSNSIDSNCIETQTQANLCSPGLISNSISARILNTTGIRSITNSVFSSIGNPLSFECRDTGIFCENNYQHINNSFRGEIKQAYHASISNSDYSTIGVVLNNLCYFNENSVKSNFASINNSYCSTINSINCGANPSWCYPAFHTSISNSCRSTIDSTGQFQGITQSCCSYILASNCGVRYGYVINSNKGCILACGMHNTVSNSCCSGIIGVSNCFNTIINGCQTYIGGVATNHYNLLAGRLSQICAVNLCDVYILGCSIKLGAGGGCTDAVSNTVYLNCLRIMQAPVSSVGLAPGTLWNDGGIAKFA